ncbi:uncharacterized protein LOC141612336 [Silene latifolia]|uniref:uncharacterized protein LOC141612336 n=1 Tax=Silene latifolia TaxID=37657 RepID=UPI003D77A956
MYQGIENYDYLEFNSTRKKKVVIVQTEEGKIFILSKGAYNIMFSRLTWKDYFVKIMEVDSGCGGEIVMGVDGGENNGCELRGFSSIRLLSRVVDGWRNRTTSITRGSPQTTRRWGKKIRDTNMSINRMNE